MCVGSIITVGARMWVCITGVGEASLCAACLSYTNDSKVAYLCCLLQHDYHYTTTGIWQVLGGLMLCAVLLSNGSMHGHQSMHRLFSTHNSVHNSRLV